jgi:hypothetical protein
MVEQLSRGNPAIRRALAIALIILAPVLGLVILKSYSTHPGKDYADELTVVALMVVVSIYLFWASVQYKTVLWDDRYLYIEDRRDSIKVPLDQLLEAHFNGADISRHPYGRATILLKSDTVFGREIKFRPVRGQKTVQELIDFIVSIQDSESHSGSLEYKVAERNL